jgi:hypothetical protein
MTEFLSELFASKIRAAVLAYVLIRPHLAFSLTDLSRALSLPVSSLQHECYKLERIGLFSSVREGNSRRYQAVQGSPYVQPLTDLIVASCGPVDVLRGCLDGIDGIDVAVLAAPVPFEAYDLEPDETMPLVLIGSIGLAELEPIGERAERLLRLPHGKIEAVYYLPDDWEDRLAEGSAYAHWLLDGPQTSIIGELPRAKRRKQR